MTRQFQPAHPWLVAVDSDGCALDSMEVKQRRCFIPATIDVWGLGDIEAAVWEVATFVNLYSRWRGTNRFAALAKTFELLSGRREVHQRSVPLPDMTPLRHWLAEEPAPSNHTLETWRGRDARETRGQDARDTHGRSGFASLRRDKDAHATLEQVLAWSREVNRRVERLAGDVVPFPAVEACLATLAEAADVVVVSATPAEALAREWSRCGLARHVRWIGGQEAGSKAMMLRTLAARYAPGHAMMVGDAPGDLHAARDAGMLFYPICPGDEDASWRGLVPAGLKRFLAGTFAGEFEQSLVRGFLHRLPETPTWMKNPGDETP